MHVCAVWWLFISCGFPAMLLIWILAGLITFYFFSLHREKGPQQLRQVLKSRRAYKYKEEKLKQNGTVSVLNLLSCLKSSCSQQMLLQTIGSRIMVSSKMSYADQIQRQHHISTVWLKNIKIYKYKNTYYSRTIKLNVFLFYFVYFISFYCLFEYTLSYTYVSVCTFKKHLCQLKCIKSHNCTPVKLYKKYISWNRATILLLKNK